MAVTLQGPLSLVAPQGKGAATRDAAATAAGDAQPRSFADILSAAQPDDDVAALAAKPGRPDDEVTGDERPCDLLAPPAMPPSFAPPAFVDAARAARGVAASPQAIDGDALGAIGPRARGETRVAPPSSGRGDEAARSHPFVMRETGAPPAAAVPIDADGVPVVDPDLAASAPPPAPAGVASTALSAGDAMRALAGALATAPGEAPGVVPVPTPKAAPPSRKATRAGESGAETADAPAANPTPSPAIGAVPNQGTRMPSAASPTLTSVVATTRDGHGEPSSQAGGENPPPVVAPAMAASGESIAPPPSHAVEAAPAPVGTTAVNDATPLAAPHAPSTFAREHGEPAIVTIDRPVGSAGWNEDVGRALAQVITVKHTTAQLHLHPESMGPVDVRISVSGAEATVQLVAPHAATREALENALPMLRDLLGSQGLALGQAAVESRAQQDTPQPQPQHAQAAGEGAVARAPAAAADTPASVARVLRLLDVFA